MGVLRFLVWWFSLSIVATASWSLLRSRQKRRNGE